MFRNKKLVVTVDKKDKEATPPAPSNRRDFEQKATFVLHKIESIGKKVFVGVCIYVALDTVRQVSVANANHPEEKE